MPPWILPGRENDPVSRYKATLQKSFAFSRMFNPRNIEFYWYPVWDQILTNLVSDIANLIVAPQFPAWFVPEDDQEDVDGKDGDGDEDEDDPEEVEKRNMNTENCDPTATAGNSALPRDDDAGEFEPGNISFASTIPQNDAKSVIVDFAVVHVTGQRQPKLKIVTEDGRLLAPKSGFSWRSRGL